MKLPKSPIPLSELEGAFYREVGSEVLKTGKFEEQDRWLLAILSQQMALSARIRKELAAGALTETTRHGGEKGSPLVAALDRATDQIMRMLIQFGLSPASRNRAQPAGPKRASDPLEEFTK